MRKWRNSSMMPGPRPTSPRKTGEKLSARHNPSLRDWRMPTRRALSFDVEPHCLVLERRVEVRFVVPVNLPDAVIANAFRSQLQDNPDPDFAEDSFGSL